MGAPMLAEHTSSLGGYALMLLPWLVPVAYFVGGLACHVHMRRSRPRPTVIRTPVAPPRNVHPVMVDALMDNEVLGESYRGQGFVEWFAACVVHAAGTDGSMVVETHTPVSDEAEAVLSSIKITRLREPSDPVDARVIAAFMPTGAPDEETRRLMDELDSTSLSPQQRERVRATLDSRRRPRRDSVTLQELLDETREDYPSMTADFYFAREALRDAAYREGYQTPDPYHGKLTHRLLYAIALLWTVFAAPLESTFVSLNGGPELPGGAVPVLVLVGCVALVWVAANRLYPWSVPLTQAGSNVSATGGALAQESADQLARQTERDQLLSASFLAAHAPAAENATQLAARFASTVDGKPGSGMLGPVASTARPVFDDASASGWRLAFAAFCSPVLVRGQSRRKTVTPLSLCADKFLQIEVDERDDGVDV